MLPPVGEAEGRRCRGTTNEKMQRVLSEGEWRGMRASAEWTPR